MLQLNLIKRRAGQFLLGFFLVTVWTVSWWAQPMVAQVLQPVAQVPQHADCRNERIPRLVEVNEIVKVNKEMGITRTAPRDGDKDETSCPRLTPLPQGTIAHVVGTTSGPTDGRGMKPWSKLDYGAWIETDQLTTISKNPQALLLSTFKDIDTEILSETSKVSLSLSTPVPIEIQQKPDKQKFVLILHNTVARPNNWPENKVREFDSPVIAEALWRQTNPDTVQIDFKLKPRQQWGYLTSYQENNLLISLRHPPKLTGNRDQPLKDIIVVVDPGHDRIESGNESYGKVEKDLNLDFSDFLDEELTKNGAKVIRTIKVKEDAMALAAREKFVNETAPALSISIHHDAYKDERDANRAKLVKGASIFRYYPQSKDPADFLIRYFHEKGGRQLLHDKDIGRERSFAVTRASGAPSVLLELGFMTNREELDELSDPRTQKRLAKVLADGIAEWIQQAAS